MGLLGGLGDIIANKTKNAISQGLLGAKQFIGDVLRNPVHYADPIYGIKAITPMVQNRFPRVGVALKQGTDFFDNVREKARNFYFPNYNPLVPKAPTATPTKAPTTTPTKDPIKSSDLKRKVRNEVRSLLETKRLTPEEYFQLRNGKQHKKKAKIVTDD